MGIVIGGLIACAVGTVLEQQLLIQLKKESYEPTRLSKFPQEVGNETHKLSNFSGERQCFAAFIPCCGVPLIVLP